MRGSLGLPRAGAAACAALCVLGLIGAPAARGQGRPFGDTRVFAGVPDPGQPAGIAVDGQRVLVSTAGVGQPVTEPRLFVYDLGTAALDRSHTVPRAMSPTIMTLLGVAVDAARRAYVVDMNGRIVRVDPTSGVQEVYADFPAAAGGLSTMPFDLAFDDAGFAYVTDQNLAAIWRVPPGGGAPRIWFQDPRLVGYFFGAAGIRLDPLGHYVYFTVALSQHPASPREGIVYRLPLVEHPSADQLEEVFRYPAQSLPFGIAFGASGKLYVALAGADQVSILRPDGPRMQEERRFPSPEENRARQVPVEDPLGVAFDGCGSLLVTNSNALSPPNPAHQVIFDVFVGDTAARLARPAIGGVGAAQEPRQPACASGSARRAGQGVSERRCLPRRSSIGARGIGGVNLGETRRQLLKRVGVQPVVRTGRSYSFCVDQSAGRVTAVFGGRGGRALLVTSTARDHGGRGVRPGVRAAVVGRAYTRRRALARGLWRASPSSTQLIGVRGGRVRFVGVADRRLIGQPALLRRHLRWIGL